MLPKTLKWSNITPEEMRKFMGLIVLMGQFRKESVIAERVLEETVRFLQQLKTNDRKFQSGISLIDSCRVLGCSCIQRTK